jgi:hypothetical protein
VGDIAAGLRGGLDFVDGETPWLLGDAGELVCFGNVFHLSLLFGDLVDLVA